MKTEKSEKSKVRCLKNADLRKVVGGADLGVRLVIRSQKRLPGTRYFPRMVK